MRVTRIMDTIGMKKYLTENTTSANLLDAMFIYFITREYEKISESWAKFDTSKNAKTNH